MMIVERKLLNEEDVRGGHKLKRPLIWPGSCGVVIDQQKQQQRPQEGPVKVVLLTLFSFVK